MDTPQHRLAEEQHQLIDEQQRQQQQLEDVRLMESQMLNATQQLLVGADSTQTHG